MMTFAEIEARLNEIESEQEALHGFDFEREMREATLSGGDLDAVEARHANIERKQRRLRIEADALTDMIPEAKRREVQPRLDEIHGQIKERRERCRKASKDAAKALDALHTAMANFIEARDTEAQRQAIIGLRNEIGQDIPLAEVISDANLYAKLAEAQRQINSQWMGATMKRQFDGYNPGTDDLAA